MPPLVILASTFVLWLAAKGRLSTYWAFATTKGGASGGATGVGGVAGAVGSLPGLPTLPGDVDEGLFDQTPRPGLGGFDWRTPGFGGSR